MAAFRPGLWRHERGHVILLGAHRATHQELRSRRSSEPTPAAISKRARPTPPTLSRSSRAGTPSKATPRTAGRGTRVTSAGACRLTPVGPVL